MRADLPSHTHTSLLQTVRPSPEYVAAHTYFEPAGVQHCRKSRLEQVLFACQYPVINLCERTSCFCQYLMQSWCSRSLHTLVQVVDAAF